MNRHDEFLKAYAAKISELKDSWSGEGPLMKIKDATYEAFVLDTSGKEHSIGTYTKEEIDSWPPIGPPASPQS